MSSIVYGDAGGGIKPRELSAGAGSRNDHAMGLRVNPQLENAYRKFNLTVGNLLVSSQQRRMRPKRVPGQGLQLLKEPLNHNAD